MHQLALLVGVSFREQPFEMIARGVRGNTELIRNIPYRFSAHHEGGDSGLSGREAKQAGKQHGIGDARYLGISDKNERRGVPWLAIVRDGDDKDGERLQGGAWNDETAGYALPGARNQLPERSIVKRGFDLEGVIYYRNSAAKADYLLRGLVGDQDLTMKIQDQDRNGEQVQTR